MSNVSYEALADWLVSSAQRREDLVGKLARAIDASPAPAARALAQAASQRGSKQSAAVEAAAKEFHRRSGGRRRIPLSALSRPRRP